MALIGRRILRSGNYTLEQTSAYDDDNPPSTDASWGTDQEIADMDQGLEQTGLELTRQGAHLTFVNTPDHFHGAVVKIRPSYTGLEAPFLEMWTYNGTAWTKRKRIPLTNVFVGTPSDTAKIFDLRLSVQLDDVTEVWITMDPGGVGTPSNRFLAIHLFGECDIPLVIPDPCDVDPEELCPDLDPCVADPDDCITPPYVPPPPVGSPPIPPWDFPTIDICDPEEVAAFEATLTPEQLAFWESLLEASELPCLDETGEPVPDPDEICQDPETFEPVPCDPDDLSDPTDEGCGYNENQRLQAPYNYKFRAATVESSQHFFFFAASDQTAFEGGLATQPQEVQDAYLVATKSVGDMHEVPVQQPSSYLITFYAFSLPDTVDTGFRILRWETSAVDQPTYVASSEDSLPIELPTDWGSYVNGLFPGASEDPDSYYGFRREPPDAGTEITFVIMNHATGDTFDHIYARVLYVKVTGSVPLGSVLIDFSPRFEG